MIGATSVLVLAPASSDADDRACCDLVSAVQADGANLLGVAVDDSPDARFDTWKRRLDTLPATVTLVSVGETTRSGATLAGPRHHAGDIVGERVEDPADLTRLGITVNRYLTEWADGPNRSLLCVHSITGLLQFADSRRVFRFLHTLVGRLGALDVTAHFHMDPTDLDRRTVATLEPLFDASMELEAYEGRDYPTD